MCTVTDIITDSTLYTEIVTDSGRENSENKAVKGYKEPLFHYFHRLLVAAV